MVGVTSAHLTDKASGSGRSSIQEDSTDTDQLVSQQATAIQHMAEFNLTFTTELAKVRTAGLLGLFIMPASHLTCHRFIQIQRYV